MATYHVNNLIIIIIIIIFFIIWVQTQTMSSLCSLLLGLLKHQRCYFSLLAHQRAKKSFHVLSFVSICQLPL